MIEILFILAFIWIVFAIFQDFKTREVENWLNFSLIIFALVIRLFYSIFTNNYDYIVFGFFGLGVFFIIGNLFYYLRLFAGGDAKLFIALGTVIPIANSFYMNTLVFFIFVIALLIGGALYSILYSFIVSFMNKDKFFKEFKKEFKKRKIYFYISLIFAIIIILSGLYINALYFFVFAILIFIFPYLYVYTKAVESSSMIKSVNVSELTVGDWLAEDIIVNGKKIKPEWEGLSEKELLIIKKNYKKKVLVKYGVQFTPAFLIAFIFILIIYYLWNSNWGFWQFF